MTVTYRCDACGKEREYLSESWHTVNISDYTTYHGKTLHFCLECISDKKEYKP